MISFYLALCSVHHAHVWTHINGYIPHTSACEDTEVYTHTHKPRHFQMKCQFWCHRPQATGHPLLHRPVNLFCVWLSCFPELDRVIHICSVDFVHKWDVLESLNKHNSNFQLFQPTGTIESVQFTRISSRLPGKPSQPCYLIHSYYIALALWNFQMTSSCGEWMQLLHKQQCSSIYTEDVPKAVGCSV